MVSVLFLCSRKLEQISPKLKTLAGRWIPFSGAFPLHRESCIEINTFALLDRVLIAPIDGASCRNTRRPRRDALDGFRVDALVRLDPVPQEHDFAGAPGDEAASPVVAGAFDPVAVLKRLKGPDRDPWPDCRKRQHLGEAAIEAVTS
ncbi:MAG: hypothetical protein AB7F74_08520 [Parvibaculaceae bacterium]